MKKLHVQLTSDVNIEEFKKAISFMSEKIYDFSIREQLVELLVDDTIDESYFLNKVQSYMKKYVNIENGNAMYEKNDAREYHLQAVMSQENEVLWNFGQGLLGLKGIGIKLFKYFDSKFREMALQCHAIEKIYPTLLPLKEYQKTGYLKNSPQYAMFCSNPVENMDVLEQLDRSVTKDTVSNILEEPKWALSPAACFHTYIEYAGKELPRESTLTFLQNVFRNEGRFNYSEAGRLRDYHVREIVFIGSEDYVNQMREKMVNLTIEFMGELDLSGDLSVASDPFIIPKLQKMKKIQKEMKSKYELHLNYSKAMKMSVASFNIHGNAFVQPFRISVKDVNEPITGCVGYGIERWMISFLCQYGFDVSNWPLCVQKEINNME